MMVPFGAGTVIGCRSPVLQRVPSVPLYPYRIGPTVLPSEQAAVMEPM